MKSPDSELATAILHDYPTAAAFQGVSVTRLARLRYNGRHKVGDALARQLVQADKVSADLHRRDRPPDRRPPHRRAG